MRYTIAVPHTIKTVYQEFLDVGIDNARWAGLYKNMDCYQFDCTPKILSFLILKHSIIILKTNNIPTPYSN